MRENSSKLLEALINKDIKYISILLALLNNLRQTDRFKEDFVTFISFVAKKTPNSNIEDQVLNEPLFSSVLQRVWKIPGVTWYISNISPTAKEFIYNAMNSPALLKETFKNIKSIENFLWTEGSDNKVIRNLINLITSDHNYFSSLISDENDLILMTNLFPNLCESHSFAKHYNAGGQ